MSLGGGSVVGFGLAFWIGGWYIGDLLDMTG